MKNANQTIRKLRQSLQYLTPFPASVEVYKTRKKINARWIMLDETGHQVCLFTSCALTPSTSHHATHIRGSINRSLKAHNVSERFEWI